MLTRLKLGAVALLALVAVTFGVVGLYTFLYADNFVMYKVFMNDPYYAGNNDYQRGAALHDHWRKLGAIYLLIAGIAGFAANRLWRGGHGGDQAPFTQKALACFDRLITAVLQLAYDSHEPGGDGAASEWHYYHFGPRCAIIRANGSMEIGSIFEVVHCYDASGKLLARRSRWKLRRFPGDRFIFGTKKVNEAYRNSPQYDPYPFGGFVNY
ncbi:MAG: hypothetical protein UY64_C0001G0011 [Parcubacteria group bacterium GW2011_GWA1_51_12]|nr:MAG: hypothetical protein UY64_C0001G0011 [Parcubacteria group bacterium GW2011_GWA1_51_12]